MFDRHYIPWTEARMACIEKYCALDIFNGKTLLELGCGFAHNGNRFRLLGANVTSSDARQEHLQIGAQLYPEIHFLRLDMDKDDIPQQYDIILHWGLLYHLREIENHLAKVANHCNILLLETEVSDSSDDTFYIEVNEGGYDQSYNEKGIRPSPTYVEKVLKKNGFNFQMILDPFFDTDSHQYSLPLQETKTWRHGFRRFWICWKDGHCPLKNASS
jgi:hypothetical protein